MGKVNNMTEVKNEILNSGEVNDNIESNNKFSKKEIVEENLIFDSFKNKKRRNITPRGMQFCLFSFCSFV